MDLSSILSLLVSNWSFEPQVVLALVLSGVLYGVGVRYSRARGMARYLENWRIVSFVAGLAVVFFALESPVDHWGGTYFWVHMLQHELLIFIAAPLLLLGMPAMLIWRGVPLEARRSSLRWVMRHRWPRRSWHAVSVWLRRPLTTWCIFIGNFTVWHLPWLYDLTLRNDTVHVLEHVLFIVTALLFWSQVIPSVPFAPILTLPMQALYLLVAALADNLLGLVFMYWTTPLYSFYGALPRTPGMLSAVADQRWAGGVMDAVGTLTFMTIIVLVLARWLEEDERAGEREDRALELRGRLQTRPLVR